MGGSDGPPAGERAGTGARMSTVLDWYRTGGPIVNVILIVGLIGFAIFVERFYVIVIRSRISGRTFIERVIQLVRAGKLEDAIKLCARSRATIPDMGLLILRSRSHDEHDLQTVADAAALAVIPRLTRRLDYFPTLAYVAMLLGGLGTIIGLREAFTSIGVLSGADRASKLAMGAAAALDATGFGIVMAIPLLIAHAYLVSQSDMILEQVDEFSIRLINALIDRPDVRLGHR
jgi:biopolymer transport protein ExbB